MHAAGDCFPLCLRLPFCDDKRWKIGWLVQNLVSKCTASTTLENASVWDAIVSEGAGLVHDGGIATSNMKGTGNQWDGSNAWPPLQAMLVEGLHRYGGAQGQQCAKVLAQLWLSSHYLGWRKYGKMVQSTWLLKVLCQNFC